jgi:hypothetical protein
MDNSFHQQKSDMQHRGGFLVSLHIFDNILTWLTGLIHLTEEEQMDAGIYFGNQSDR